MNSLFDIPVKIKLKIERIITGNPNTQPAISSDTLATILETKTRLIPIIANGKTFLFKVSIPAVKPKANAKMLKMPTTKSAPE